MFMVQQQQKPRLLLPFNICWVLLTKREKKMEALKGLRSLLIKAGKSVLTVCVCLSDCTSLWEGAISYQSALSASVRKERRG